MQQTTVITYIDIAAFRQENRLTQSALARYLGTSRSFINQADNKKVKLPKDKIDSIFANKQWDPSLLAPAYSRILIVQNEFEKMGVSELLDRILDRERLDKFRYGEITITESLADEIIAIFPKKKFNKAWLLDGKKPIFIKRDTSIQDQIDELRSMMETGMSKLEKITRELARLQAHLGLTP